MKKLMILGGSRYALPVIKSAHELGLYVITADYLPENIAHRYSDEYCNVNIIDKEATLKEARLRNIDGIMSFACDPGVVTAAYVAEQLGLPSVGSFEAGVNHNYTMILQSALLRQRLFGGRRVVEGARAEDPEEAEKAFGLGIAAPGEEAPEEVGAVGAVGARAVREERPEGRPVALDGLALAPEREFGEARAGAALVFAVREEGPEARVGAGGGVRGDWVDVVVEVEGQRRVEKVTARVAVVDPGALDEGPEGVFALHVVVGLAAVDGPPVALADVVVVELADEGPRRVELVVAVVAAPVGEDRRHDHPRLLGPALFALVLRVAVDWEEDESAAV